MLEVFHPISLEENQQDERPQAQDEAVRRMPVFLVGLLRRQGGVKEGEKEGLETTQIARERERKSGIKKKDLKLTKRGRHFEYILL